MRPGIPDVLLRRHEQEDALDPPLVIAYADMVGLSQMDRTEG